MGRQSVSEDELLEWINSELSKDEQCNDCSFISVTRLRDEAPDGCNWSDAQLRCSGVSTQVCAPIAKSIIDQARKQFNIK